MDQLLIIPVDRKRPHTFRICVILGLTALMLLAVALDIPGAAASKDKAVAEGMAPASGLASPIAP